MERVWLHKTNLVFASLLSQRYQTDEIILHHTGASIDASAEEIHRWHLANGWAGIGYHFVVRKNGAVEIGRPIDTVGAHTYGENWHTIGIQLSGNLSIQNPTDLQIESTAMLIANLSADFSIPIDHEHIFGHCHYSATDCPGRNLILRLNELIGKARWYKR